MSERGGKRNGSFRGGGDISRHCEIGFFSIATSAPAVPFGTDCFFDTLAQRKSIPNLPPNIMIMVVASVEIVGSVSRRLSPRVTRSGRETS